ncbi:hypothetical protein CTAYLR_007574 [Chrysophaeum taylorii]|uniref:J domain-containing protein n=1 Tax=Chrysophaeum taylorii TaxID=2483200 RepID=A0AAD7XM22_9STRA|nr:hypothetical protein CTAYLR_007574 [Chrysophaeum taylorii]
MASSSSSSLDDNNNANHYWAQLRQERTFTDAWNSAVDALLADEDLYHVLGVEKCAPAAQIKSAFTTLSLEFHSDKGGADVIQSKLNEAYATLCNEERRAKYDRFLDSKDSNWFVRYMREVGTNYVEETDLEAGDHVFYYVGASTHDGVVVDASRVVDFDGRRVRVARVATRALTDGRESGVADESCSFLPGGRCLRRVRYDLKGLQSVVAGGYPDASQDARRVVERARRIGTLDAKRYLLLDQSCESVAFWCKTGKRYSGQTEKADHVLGGLTTVSGLATTSLAVAGALATTVVVDAAMEASLATAVVITCGLSVAVALGPLSTVLLAVVFGGLTWRARDRWLLVKTQPEEVVALLAELAARDRRACGLSVLSEAEVDAVLSLSANLDALAESPEKEKEKKKFRRRCCELFSDFFGKFSKALDADAALSFATHVLVRCSVFNAVLDLPEPDGADDASYVATTLKSAELAILDARREVSIRVDGVASREGCRELEIALTCRRSDGGEPVLFQVARKPRDFDRLHDVLLELHPKVRDIARPTAAVSQILVAANILDDNPQAYAAYLAELLRLATPPARARSFSRDAYLYEVQATELYEQLLEFFGPDYYNSQND